jgi:Integrase core domain
LASPITSAIDGWAVRYVTSGSWSSGPIFATYGEAEAWPRHRAQQDKARSPQANGIVERLYKTMLSEFYRVLFRKTIYSSVEQPQTDLEAWLDTYNRERELIHMMIDEPKVADFLRRPEALVCLGPFVARERTVRAAADELAIPVERLNYWVRKFAKHKLIEFVRYEKTQRHRAAVYRSVDDEFTIPHNVNDFHDALRIIKSMHQTSFELLQRSYARGMESVLRGGHIRFYRDANGRTRFITSEPVSARQVGFESIFQRLHLNADEIEALSKELDAVAAKWLAVSDRESKPKSALLYLGLAANPVSIFEI